MCGIAPIQINPAAASARITDHQSSDSDFTARELYGEEACLRTYDGGEQE